MSKFTVGQAVVDGAGRTGRIIAVDARGEFPIVALMEQDGLNSDRVKRYRPDGRYRGHYTSADIRPAPKVRVEYRSLYVASDGSDVGAIGYSSPYFLMNQGSSYEGHPFAGRLRLTFEDDVLVDVALEKGASS